MKHIFHHCTSRFRFARSFVGVDEHYPVRNLASSAVIDGIPPHVGEAGGWKPWSFRIWYACGGKAQLDGLDGHWGFVLQRGGTGKPKLHLFDVVPGRSRDGSSEGEVVHGRCRQGEQDRDDYGYDDRVVA